MKYILNTIKELEFFLILFQEIFQQLFENQLNFQERSLIPISVGHILFKLAGIIGKVSWDHWQEAGIIGKSWDHWQEAGIIGKIL